MIDKTLSRREVKRKNAWKRNVSLESKNYKSASTRQEELETQFRNSKVLKEYLEKSKQTRLG